MRLKKNLHCGFQPITAPFLQFFVDILFQETYCQPNMIKIQLFGRKINALVGGNFSSYRCKILCTKYGQVLQICIIGLLQDSCDLIWIFYWNLVNVLLHYLCLFAQLSKYAKHNDLTLSDLNFLLPAKAETPDYCRGIYIFITAVSERIAKS